MVRNVTRHQLTIFLKFAWLLLPLACAPVPVLVTDAGPIPFAAQPQPEKPELAPLTLADLKAQQDVVAQSGQFAVATAHPLATQAAVDVLKKQGTAVDALVAASFMLAVVVPQSTGIGGGGFAVVWPGDNRQARAVDFRETAPEKTDLHDYLDPEGKALPQLTQHHGLAVATPGYVAGLWRLHRKFGSLPWVTLVQPAVEVARRGFPIGRDLAKSIQNAVPFLNAPAKRVFAPGGVPLKPDDVLKQPELAQTLQLIADEGPNAFYSGPLAADLVKTVQDAGGKLTLEDLQRYEVREFAPLEGDVAGRHLLTMPQPSAGGAQVLAMAEHFGALPVQWPADPALLPHVFAELMRRSFVLRLAFTGDVHKPAATLDAAFPLAARKLLQNSLDLQHATPTDKLPQLPPGNVGENHANTSHVSIIDGAGMAVASTHTVNLYLGSALVTQGGVLLNNEMDDFTFALQSSNYFGLAGSAQNLARPNARPVSSMTPLIVLEHGKPVLVLGSPGGTRIPTTVFQIMARLLWLHEPLKDAVHALRVHHQARPDNVFVEEGAAGDGLAKALIERGHTVVRQPPWCNVQAVSRTCADGKCALEAVSDPRGEGAAAAF